MSLKKKLGSKLASSVRQVKSLREQNPASAPDKIAPAVKPPASLPTPANVSAKPVAPRAAQPRSVTGSATSSDSLHPRRVWPD